MIDILFVAVLTAGMWIGGQMLGTPEWALWIIGPVCAVGYAISSTRERIEIAKRRRPKL